jgi:enoyl-CoA hydratase
MNAPLAVPESSVIDVEVDEHIARVWLNRPEKLNAMGLEFWTDLPAIVNALGDHPDVRVIVIAGRGKAFTVGIDLMAFGPMFAGSQAGGGQSSEASRRMTLYHQIKRMQDTFSSLADCPKPVIVAVHGYCLGGGIDLITAADIRLAASDAVFSVRETKMAMVADVGTLQRLPNVINPGHVADLVYTGRDVGASEALDMGLVSRVYPDADSLLKGAEEMARQIAANSPLAVQGAKAVLRAGDGKTVAEHLDYVALWNASFLQSDDLMEAMQAFLAKREADFTG